MRRLFSSTTLYDSLSCLPKSIPCSKSLTWYVCGPTVYDVAHVGHARTYVTLDIARRVLGHLTQSPILYALGVTDIDDKIIARAVERGTTPPALARRYEAEFLRDLAALNCLPPTALLRVSEHIPEITRYIEGLLASGGAYSVPSEDPAAGASVYLSVPALGSAYGKLAPPGVAAGAAGGGEAPAPPPAASSSAGRGKRDPRDFALWKGVAPSASGSGPSAAAIAQGWAWDSPWGLGRPGWHIECSAMTRALYGDHIDIHAGGIDLAFPHHCNECAQADAWMAAQGSSSSYEWVRCWVHTGHVHVDGLKMSKSLKNFTAISDMLGSSESSSSSSAAGVSDAFRLWCLTHHYRSSLTFSQARLDECAVLAGKLQGFLAAAAAATASASASAGHPGAVKKWGAREHALHQHQRSAAATIRQCLQSDLDTPGATAALLELCAAGRGYLQLEGARPELLQSLALEVAHTSAMLGLRCGEQHLAQRSLSPSSSGASAAAAAAAASSTAASADSAQRLVEHRASVKGVALALRAGVKRAGGAGGELAGVALEASGQLLKQCDSLRDAVLPGMGWSVQDLPSGPLVVKK